MRISSLVLQGNVFLAPMAGITDTPFRRIVQDFGISALWTEMISADGYLAARSEFRTIDLYEHNVPTIFQVSGTRPENMALVAEHLESKGAAAIDVNMGCPVRRVVSRGAGAALMNNLDLALEIVRSIKKLITIPLTAKIRSGWDEHTQNAVEFARALEDAGCDALTIHSRSRSKVHSGPADIDIIGAVKQAVGIPVIGNGGINTFADAQEMLQKSGCDALMIGRGALGRPWFPGHLLNHFGKMDSDCADPTFTNVIRKHLTYELEWWGDLSAVRKMRKHLAWYSKGFADGAEFRRHVFRLENPDEVMDSVEQFFGKVAIHDF